MEMYHIQRVLHVCNKDVKSSFFFNMPRLRENVYLLDLWYIDIFKIRLFINTFPSLWNIFSIRLNMREEICMGVYGGEPSGPQCITDTDQLENFIKTNRIFKNGR